MDSSRWFVLQKQASRRLRLYCFSHAGGSANIYSNWQSELSPFVEVCAIELPGRGQRFAEAPFTSLAETVEKIADVLTRENVPAFAFFGHSMGGLIAFELTRLLQDRREKLPLHLFVSGCNPPCHQRNTESLHTLPEDKLITALSEYGGTPSEVLAHDELMKLLLPTIRTDLSMAEKYQYRKSQPLDTPITVLAGTADSHISGNLTDWQNTTCSYFAIKWFEGDHFFINKNRQSVLSFLKSELNCIKIFN